MSSVELCKFGQKNQYGVIICKKTNESCKFQRYCHSDCMWVQSNNYMTCLNITI